MDLDELEALLSGKTLFDFRAERAFKAMDKDKSGTLQKQEIMNFMIDSIEGDVDEVHLEEDLKNWEKRDINKDKVYDLNEFKMIY